MINILNIDGVSFEYGNRNILSDIFLDIRTGVISGLLGRNGAGKSTLLNILSGYIKAPNSSIRLNGDHLESSMISQGVINFCPQYSYIPGEFSIKKIFFDYDLKLSDFNKTFKENQIQEKQQYKHLSGGEKRLLDIFLVVKSKTMFTILDEPFSFLMPIHIEKVKELIISEIPSKGYIITDHLYEHVLELCDQVYLLKEGKTHLANNQADLIDLGYILPKISIY